MQKNNNVVPSFLEIVERRAEIKLNALKKELTEKHSLDLGKLRLEKKRLAKELTLLSQKRKQEGNSRDKLLKHKLLLNKHIDSYRSMMESLWSEVVIELLSKPETRLNWIKRGLNVLPKDAGLIRANKSDCELIKSILPKKHEYSIAIDAEIDGGFVYESGSVFIDATVSLYIKNDYRAIEIELYEVMRTDEVIRSGK